jgi:hypothetical protein
MLNILPLQKKKEIKLKKMFNTISRTTFLLWLLLIIPAGLLIGSHYFLQSIEKDMTDASTISNQEKLQNIAVVSQAFNEYLKQSAIVQTNHINPIPLLDHFSQLIPAGVTIRGINISLTEKTIAFSGEAQTRDQLLELENNFSNDSMFSDFTYPLSNLSEKENIKFDLAGKIQL